MAIHGPQANPFSIMAQFQHTQQLNVTYDAAVCIGIPLDALSGTSILCLVGEGLCLSTAATWPTTDETGSVTLMGNFRRWGLAVQWIGL